MDEPRTFSVAEMAAATGYARQSVSRAVRDGRLNRWLVRDSKGHARLMPEAATAIRSGVLRLRVDSKAANLPPPPAPDSAPAPSAELWAPWANGLLDLTQWSPPPWDATRWRTLLVVAAEAEGLAQQWGEFDSEILAGLVEAGEL